MIILIVSLYLGIIVFCIYNIHALRNHPERYDFRLYERRFYSSCWNVKVTHQNYLSNSNPVVQSIRFWDILYSLTIIWSFWASAVAYYVQMPWRQNAISFIGYGLGTIVCHILHFFMGLLLHYVS
ncbi:MAG: hypothetical protein IJ744_05480 [Lachnospiraceae bacterium]|nr:hypothetical protein [Lachnospiraceae bacterium]